MHIAKLPAVRARAKREGWLDQIRSPADERAALRGCYFSRWHAERVDTFCRTFCCHSKGQWAGQPFELLPWQRNDLVYPLFGWMRADGTRRYRRAYIEVAKKNGKSALVSALGLYLLIADNEPGAEVYSCASDRPQASIVHGEAVNMVDASPALQSFLTVNRSTFAISHHDSKSVYRAWSGTGKGKSGFNAHGILCDELQEWQGRELWENLIHAGRARRQPLLIVITNAGDDMLSVCREQHDYAERVLDGTFDDDRFFGLIYAVSKEELDRHGTHDRRLWRKANPSLGITINEEDFGRDLEEAERTPTAWAEFCRKSFSIWNTGQKRWLQLMQWRACLGGNERTAA
jgi:phage terminase large subunit-like protein